MIVLQNVGTIKNFLKQDMPHLTNEFLRNKYKDISIMPLSPFDN